MSIQVYSGYMLEETFRSYSINATLISAGLLVLLTIISMLIKHKSEALAGLLFWSIVVVVLVNTIFLAGLTLTLNSKSSTGGPVHWHADFEIWDCGVKQDIINPTGLSNKVGTPTFHEHNDDRIHLEGVIIDPKEIRLGRFFEVIGGSITDNQITVPLATGVMARRSGDMCPDGTQGELQVFLYRTVNNVFSQQKLVGVENFILAPEPKVPPGDCLIIEFGSNKDRTEKLCNFYKVGIQKGEISGY